LASTNRRSACRASSRAIGKINIVAEQPLRAGRGLVIAMTMSAAIFAIVMTTVSSKATWMRVQGNGRLGDNQSHEHDLKLTTSHFTEQTDLEG